MDPYLVPKRERKRGEGESPGRGHPVFAVWRALVILLFGVLIVQLVRLQVIQGDEYAERAEINALREAQIPAARGLILDREGRPLVLNTARFSAAIVPGDLPERGEMGIFQQLERVTGVPTEDIERRVRAGIEERGAFGPVVIKQDVDEDVGVVLRELEPVPPGLKLLTEPTREYLAGPLLSHILGYVGPISEEQYEELRDQGYLLQAHTGTTGGE